MATTTYGSAGGTNSAVKDDPNKLKAPNLPYMDPNNPTAIVPLTNSAVTGSPQNSAPAQSQVQPMASQVQPAQQPVQQNPNTMRDQAMSTLLTKANTPQQTSQVQNLVNQKTTGLLQDPNQGWNGEAYKNTQLSNYDKNEAQLFESLRQQFADSADTGQFRKEGLQNQLDSLGNRRTLESDIDYENRDYNQKSLLSALAEGRATETQNQTIQNTPIDNLVKALQAGEGDAQRTADVDTREDVQGYQTGERLSEEQFQAQQADLDRQLQTAMQNNDIVAQKEITQLKSTLDMQQQIQSQGFEATQAQLSRDLETSLQANDIEATRSSLEKQLAMDKYKTDQGTKLTEEQNSLNRALEVTLSDMDAETQKAVVSLRGKIDEGMLVKEQDWKSVEADLERKQQEAIANGDWQNALDIENRRGEIQASAQKSQQDYDNAQRIAIQSYNTGERLSTQDYQTGLKYLDSALTEAQANNDFGRTKVLEQDKFNFEYNMQNSGFTQEEKMANIAADLQEARANNDQGREIHLMGLQAATDFEKMRVSNGYEESLTNLRGQIDQAAAEKNFGYSTQLKAQEINAIAEESAKDRAIELSELALKQDAQKWATYEAMKNAGDPEGAASFLKKELASQGIAYNPVDAYAQAKAAIATDFELQKEQYLLTHPSLKGFNEFYNESMFGEVSQEEYVDQVVTGQLTYQQMKSNPEALAAAQTEAPVWNADQKETGFGTGSVKAFQSPPEKNIPFSYNGATVMRTSDVMTRVIKGNDDLQYFNAIDLNTGKSIKIETKG